MDLDNQFPSLDRVNVSNPSRKDTNKSFILSLPVQNLPEGYFNSSQLTWYTMNRGKSPVDVAVIPYDRMDDFVCGESSLSQCSTSFARTKSSKQPLHTASVTLEHRSLVSCTYWCSYGGADYRDQMIHPEHNKHRPNRERKKRGCTCHFICKQLAARPSDVLITYVERRHVDKNGLPCHGPEDISSGGKRPLHAMHLSSEKKHWVYSLLYMGLSYKTIYDKHIHYINQENGRDPNREATRDDFLKLRDVQNLARRSNGIGYQLHPNGNGSVGKWVAKNPSDVFIFRKDEQFSFILGLQTHWQLEQLVRFGNRSELFLDSTCDLTCSKYFVYTVLAFDSQQTGIPVAWVIVEEVTQEVMFTWLTALKKRILEKDATWSVASFLIDESVQCRETISDIFGCRLPLSLWRVRRSWLERLSKDVYDVALRAEMYCALGKILRLSTSEEHAMESFAKFKVIFAMEMTFLSYFEEYWIPQICRWFSEKREFAHPSHEVNGALPYYHSGLNEQRPEARNISETRLDWLINRLMKEVHSYYWYGQYAKKNGLCRTVATEHLQNNAWQNALKIPDGDVVWDSLCFHIAKVHNQLGGHPEYFTLWNPGSEYSLCDCGVPICASTCEHIAKLYMVWNVHLKTPKYLCLESPPTSTTSQINSTSSLNLWASLVGTLHHIIETLPQDFARLESASRSIHRLDKELKSAREIVVSDTCDPTLALVERMGDSAVFSEIKRNQEREAVDGRRNSGANNNSEQYLESTVTGNGHRRKLRRVDKMTHVIYGRISRESTMGHYVEALPDDAVVQYAPGQMRADELVKET
ncbi:uncharacterized protein LOC18422177 isoform X1 [Amborella trichopoda]|uniref:uncharacterized protein LOC18422177 isoform X1 n=1 Tax=Amborella trichopoda TaxID=13333 RepID=UPI0009BF03BB|nr:uncharacterized protein LOC18422177 isoform X1 [Amborella trichopoda]|eukprot:XP_011622982.2 uncharacterized protein LOC18422177 isoform X1 [Amborella trichopoda]